MTLYASNREAGAKSAITPAIVAGVIAPLLIGFEFQSWSPLLMLGTAAAAGLLVFLLLGLRRMIGGIESLELNAEGVTTLRKGVPTALAWGEVEKASFESVNGTPWLILRPDKDKGKKQSICLEDFEEDARRAITEAFIEHMPERTCATETWLVSNRIPITVKKNGVEITQ